MTDPGPPQLFLSYSRSDGATVAALNALLLSNQVTTFFDAIQIAPGSLWPEVLEGALNSVKAVAVFLGPSGLGPWQRREMFFAIDRQVAEETAGRRFPVIPVVLRGVQSQDLARGFLSLNTWIDSRQLAGDDAVAAELVKAMGANQAATGAQSRQTVCPYLGLSRFTELDAPLYFGRDQYAQELFEKVQHHEMTCVVGPSGSGKSSLVFAGLVPRLRKQRPPVWEVLSFTPGQDPWISMANAFLEFTDSDLPSGSFQKEAGILADVFETGRAGVSSSVDGLLKKSNGSNRLLVVVDQFEELITLSLEKHRRAFVERLLELCQSSKVRVMLTLRADYYSKAIGLSRDLTEKMTRGQVTLAPMRPEEVLEAVQRPAALVKLPIESALLDRIRDEVAGQPNSLPLLEYALVEVWKQNRSQLTYESYVKIGRVAGAIATSADGLYKALTPAEKDAARRLFLRLVRVADLSEDGADTRYRARKSDVSDLSWAVALRFAHPDIRLLVVSGPTDAENSQEGSQTVEVAHEALIREWETLKEWIKSDRDFLLWRQRLALKIAEWERTNRSDAGLLTGFFLDEARTWLDRRMEDLNETERAYIDVPTADSFQIRKVVEDARDHSRYAAAASASIWWGLLYLYRPDGVAEQLRQSPDREMKQQAFRILAGALAATDDKGLALEFAREISDPAMRAAAFADVAGRISKSSERDRLLSVAAETASALDPLNLGDARRPALTVLLRALAGAGERDAAAQMAKRFEAPSAGFSKILVTELTGAGDWQYALEVTRDASLSKERMDLSIAILNAMKPAEQSAIEVVAREATSALDATWNRRWGLKGLIDTLVRIQAGAVAIGIARAQNEADGNRAAALTDCAGVILKTDASLAASLAHEAWDAALKISVAYTRKGILGEALLIWAKAGGADAGIQAARHLTADEDRAHVLTQAVLYYGEVKNAERAGVMVTEALDTIRRIPNSYARRDPAGGLLTVCLACGMLPEATTVAREALEPDGRCQVLLAVLTKRLKDFQCDFLEEIADEVFRAVAEDSSSYNRNRNLSALLKLADESDLGPEWVWGRIKAMPEPSLRRELFSSAVSPGRFQLIASMEDVGDRDAILSAYALKFEGDQGKTVGKITDAGVRDETLQKLCASRIRSGKLSDARELVGSVQSRELEAGILLDIASGYLKQGNSYVAVEFCKRIARSATPGAVEAAIELLAQCREAPEARAAVREIVTSLGGRTSQNRDFALGLWALARTNPPLETIEYLTASEPPEPVAPRTWFARAFSKPAKREPKSPIEIASGINLSTDRVRALASLCVAYARADQADLAIEAAERIEDAGVRRSVLTEAARFSAGPTFEKMLACAIDSARALKDEFYRKRALAELLPLAAKSPEFSRAVALAREAAGSDLEFAQYLVSLIPLRIETAGPPEVSEIVSEAQSLFSKQPTWQRDAGMRSLVFALCSAGLYKEALRLAGEAEPIGARAELLQAAIAPLSSAPSGVWALAAARALIEQLQDKPDYERKRQALAVAKSLRAAGLHADALTILREISAAPGTKEYVNSVAPALAESGFLDEALALAESAPEASGKAEALTSLIPFAAANDRDVAALIAGRVLVSLRTTKETYSRRQATARLVQELDKAGLYDSLSKGYLTDPIDLIVVDLTHMKGLLQRGNRKSAWAVAEATLEAAAKVRDSSWERDQMIEDLTKTLMQAGVQPDQLASHAITVPIIVKVQLASNDIQGALKIALGITNTEALRSLSVDFAHAGHFEEALKIAERIPMEQRGLATTSLVSILAQSGATARAVEIAVEIADPSERSTALRDIALIQVKSDALPGALNLARLIPEAGARTQVLAQIATAHADRNHPDRAETVAIEAETSLAEIAGYENKARGAARVAIVWAALHKYQRSRELAASCHLPNERVLACSAILRDYLLISRPDLREAVAAIPKGEI